MSVDQATNSTENVSSHEETSSRRGTLAALLAGSALGLAALNGVAPTQAAKGKKGKKKKGKGGGNAGASTPSVRYVYKTTTFDSAGFVTASSECPEGYVPINAGLTDSFTNSVIVSSFPRLTDNSWVFELDGARVGHQATVIAVCLAASDDTTVEDTEHRAARRRRGKRGRRK